MSLYNNWVPKRRINYGKFPCDRELKLDHRTLPIMKAILLHCKTEKTWILFSVQCVVGVDYINYGGNLSEKIPYSLCILDAAHDRILSVRTSYSHYFTNCYEATNLRNLLIYHYWSNFYTKYLLRGSFFRYLFSEHSFSEIFEESNIPSLNFQKIILKFSCCRNKKSLEILICCGN